MKNDEFETAPVSAGLILGVQSDIAVQHQSERVLHFGYGLVEGNEIREIGLFERFEPGILDLSGIYLGR
jgi:hypothetical protein